MTKFEISSRTSGYTIGVYEAANVVEALDALAREGGFVDYEAYLASDIYDQDDAYTRHNLIADRVADLIIEEVN